MRAQHSNHRHQQPQTTNRRVRYLPPPPRNLPRRNGR